MDSLSFSISLHIHLIFLLFSFFISVERLEELTLFPGGTLIRDTTEGRIKKTSYMHGHSIFTVEKHLIAKKIGRVNKKKLEDVKSIIKKALKV